MAADKFMKKGSVVLGNDKAGKPKFATVGSDTVSSTDKKILKGIKVAPEKAEKGKAPKAEKPAAKPAKGKAAPAKKETKTAKAPKAEPTQKITLLVKDNPKREGSTSYDRFELYKKNKTVASFLEAGGTSGDIRYDVTKGYIKLA